MSQNLYKVNKYIDKYYESFNSNDQSKTNLYYEKYKYWSDKYQLEGGNPERVAALSLVKKDGLQFNSLESTFKYDPEIIKEAIKQNPLSLEFIDQAAFDILIQYRPINMFFL
jgi:hypothetical protein